MAAPFSAACGRFILRKTASTKLHLDQNSAVNILKKFRSMQSSSSLKSIVKSSSIEIFPKGQLKQITLAKLQRRFMKVAGSNIIGNTAKGTSTGLFTVNLVDVGDLCDDLASGEEPYPPF